MSKKIGRPTQLKVRKTITELRKKNLSFQEIGDIIGMSRQRVRYFFSTPVDKSHIDRKDEKK